mgnify:CR=1 FL=1
MLFCDSQVHVWGANTPERPWPARAHAQREIPLGHEELLREMDAAGVQRLIIVPPSWEGDRNDLALAALDGGRAGETPAILLEIGRAHV